MKLFNPFSRKLPDHRIVWCIGIPYTKKAFLDCCKKTPDSDFIDSLEFQYKTEDVEILWRYYMPVAEMIAETVEFLRKLNVEVIELYSVEQLPEIFSSYSEIIITAHRNRYMESLDFNGNATKIQDVVDSIPANFNGIADISSCYSSTFLMKCKQKAINAAFIAAETESSLELRLFIYKHTIKHLVAHQKGNYLESFRIIIGRIIDNSKNDTHKKKSVFLGGSNSVDELSQNASAFAPDEIKRGEDMMIQVYIYKEGGRSQALCEARKADKDALERNFVPMNFDIPDGELVNVTLNVFNFPEMTQSKSLIWKNNLLKTYFIVSVPENYRKEKLFVNSIISIGNAVLGELFFSVAVVENYSPVRHIAKVLSRRFNKVFISYSHLDEQQVRFIAQAYKAIGADYFFDRHYLTAGSVYPEEIREYIDSADLFILCWSKNASESDYIQKELSQALSLAFPQIQPKEAARLTIYPLIIGDNVELPANMKGIYNFADV